MKNIYTGKFQQQTVSSFISRISIIFLLIFITGSGWSQVATNGDYRTRSTGTWTAATTWQVRTAGSWANTAIAPSPGSNIYVQNGHTITVNIAAANCNDLQINTGGAIVVGANTLQVSGKLRAYTGSTVTTTGGDGTFYSSQASNVNPGNAMLSTSGAGVLKFIGATRNITNTGEWGSALTSYATEFALNAANTGTLQTGYKSSSILVSSGIIDMGSNRLSPDNGNSDQGNLTISANATVISANSGASSGNSVFSRTTNNKAGTFNLNGKLVLSGPAPEIQFTTININPGSTIEYSRAGSQVFLTSSFAGAAPVNSYVNLSLSGSLDKTPNGNFTVAGNVDISGSAVLVLGALTASVGGNWTSYGDAGLNQQSGTVDFNGSGAQSINTSGGENFYIMKKSGAGTLTLNSNVAVNGGGASALHISAGVLDAGLFTLDGSVGTALVMSGGTLKQAKLNTTLPEFPIGAYNLTGGTIELNGAGVQTLRGGRDYRNLSFSNSGTKGLSSGITSITGTITLANTVLLDVDNNNMGGAGTNLTMTGTSTYKTAGSFQTKPDAQGTYTLGTGTTVEFSNMAGGLESVRLSPNYYNIVVSGTGVGTTSPGTGIKIQSGGSFTVKNGAVFKLQNSNGFSGAINTSLDNTNNPSINLEAGSTIEYNGTNQFITNQVIQIPSNANYENLILGGGGIKTAPAGVLAIRGDLTNKDNSIFAHNSGTVIMNGTGTQAYNSTVPVMEFYNLTNNNTVDLSINNDLGISAELAFGAGSKLNLQSGYISMRSTQARTSNIGRIPATASIGYFADAAFIIERYIATGNGPSPQHGKSWQLLAVPANGGQTVHDAWQEGHVLPFVGAPGLGTIITNNTGVASDSFDITGGSGPSMKTYDTSGTGSWKGINNTNVALYNKKGYMIFIRGDRTAAASIAVSKPTTLRSTGKIFHPVSNIPPQTTVGAGKFESIGNPYASAIDFSDELAVIKSPNIQRVFYVWDPKLGGGNGFGAYQTFTKGTGTDYTVSPGGGSYGAGGSVNNVIESGQAFFVHAVGGAGTVSFTENAKVGGSNIFTRQVMAGVPAGKQLRTNLYTYKGSDRILVDGVVNEFDRSYSSSVDILDALKIQNTGESLGLSIGKELLAVERRASIRPADTVMYNLQHLSSRQYEFELVPGNLAAPGLKAFLEDGYLKTITPVSLENTTTVKFEVNSDAGSYQPARFRLVFAKKRVTDMYSILDAVEHDAVISLRWATGEGQENGNPVVERSADGAHFSALDLQNTGQGARSSSGQWVDSSPLEGNNFYRVKTTGATGISYSNTVNIMLGASGSNISVYPNPVTGGQFRLSLNGQLAGRYKARLVNPGGQLVKEWLISVKGGHFVQALQLPTLPAGTYRLILVGEDRKMSSRAIVVQ